MISIYAIKSKKKDWIYVGQTDNLERRLKEHNAGFNKSTKPYLPFEIIFQETYLNRNDARLAEKYYKSAAGKRKLRTILKNLGPV
jgi:putative endonuclease